MPLVYWSIVQAQFSKVLSGLIWKIAVSTDDAEIADVANEYGAEVISRPPAMATAEASIYDGIRHAIEAVGGCDAVCLLQPTSPLRMPGDITGCLELFLKNLLEVVSVAEGQTVPNGAVYVGRTEWLLGGGNWDDGSALAYVMPSERSADINTLEEFEAAERMARAQRFQRPV